MSIEKASLLIVLVGFGVFSSMSVFTSASQQVDKSRGEYIVMIGGCNDCHTTDFAASDAAIQKSKWLLGDSLGFRGPWGTTYPTNLRQYINDLSEEGWISSARELKTRPPMPWWALNVMTVDDLKAMYTFIKALGIEKNIVPSYVSPGEVPKTPYIQWPEPPK